MPQIYHQWQIRETHHYNKGAVWYALAGLTASSLIFISVWQKNILFAIILLMVAVLYIFFHHDEVQWIELEISEDGISIDKRLYPYKDISNFWINEESLDIYIKLRHILRPPLRIPLPGRDNQEEISSLLEKFIKKSSGETGESVSVTLSRLFKL